MVRFARTGGYGINQSWTQDCAYSRGKPSAALIDQCRPYRFAPVAEVAAKAAEEFGMSDDPFAANSSVNRRMRAPSPWRTPDVFDELRRIRQELQVRIPSAAAVATGCRDPEAGDREGPKAAAAPLMAGLITLAEVAGAPRGPWPTAGGEGRERAKAWVRGS